MTTLNSWKKSLIPLSTSLDEVIRNLNETCLQIALVVSPDGILLGTITDGDIRRGLLRGLSINSSIEEIVFRDPIVVPPEMGRDMVLQLMQANKIYQLPVVDEKRRVAGLHLRDELMVPPLRPNLMVIMAGGQGSRMLPHTENCPKPLLKVEGKPILEHIIERAREDGFQHFVLATHYLGEMIEDYFGDGSRWQVKISCLREESPLGTAGAISLLDPRPEIPFIVSNGDVLTDIHYGEILDFHCLHNASATMAVRLHEWQNPFGVVRTNGVDIVGFEEKPVIRSHINAGVYALEPEALNALSVDEFCDMPTLFSRLQDEGTRTIVYPMHEPWLDVGRAKDLELANAKHSSET
jgi:dTDP-glucose pyrophosphorylase